MTPERLREIEARCEAATAGPWSWMTWLGGQWALYAPGNAPHETGKPVPLNAPDDISFAAQARTDIPDLISALKQAREERDGLAEQNGRLRDEIEHLQMQAENAQSLCRHRSTEKQLTECDSCFVIAEALKHTRTEMAFLSDPAECLTVRDAAVRQQACVEAIVVARETAGARARIIQALHDHFAKDLPESAAELIWAQADRVQADSKGGSGDRH